MITLQDRDKYLLKKLSKYTILSNKIVNRLYGNTTYAVRKRKTLADEGYIEKTKYITYLAAKGKQYLEAEGRSCRETPYKKETQKRIAKMTAIYIQLEKYYYCYPSWQVKEEANENKLLFYGKVRNKLNGKEYYVYNIGKLQFKDDAIESYKEKAKKFKIHYLERVKREIEQLRKDKNLKRVILFYDDENTMQMYRSKMESMELQEQLLMPNTEKGMELLNTYGREDAGRKIVEKLYGNYLDSPHWAFADYTIKQTGKQIVVLLLYDCTKIKLLQDFIESCIPGSKIKNDIEIVCFEGQHENLPEVLRSIPIRTVKWEDVVETNKEDETYMQYINTDQVDIIKLINKFGCIRKDQIKKILKLKVIEKTDSETGERRRIDKGEIMLQQMAHSRRIPVKCENDIFYANQQNINEAMIKALDVPAYMIDNGHIIAWCEPSDYPFALTFYMNEHVYDIAIMEENEELAMSALIEKSKAERIIIIINSFEQVPKINIKNKMIQYCILKPELKFYEMK